MRMKQAKASVDNRLLVLAETCAFTYSQRLYTERTQAPFDVSASDCSKCNHLNASLVTDDCVVKRERHNESSHTETAAPEIAPFKTAPTLAHSEPSHSEPSHSSFTRLAALKRSCSSYRPDYDAITCPQINTDARNVFNAVEYTDFTPFCTHERLETPALPEHTNTLDRTSTRVSLPAILNSMTDVRRKQLVALQ